jgi:hypothetical protein|tara:strand:- start:899 stop:1030 length:132 start_codon:yes stop_codon:yes gene_type:complete
MWFKDKNNSIKTSVLDILSIIVEKLKVLLTDRLIQLVNSGDFL